MTAAFVSITCKLKDPYFECMSGTPHAWVDDKVMSNHKQT